MGDEPTEEGLAALPAFEIDSERPSIRHRPQSSITRFTEVGCDVGCRKTAAIGLSVRRL